MFEMNAAKVQDIIRNYKVRLFHFQGFLLICTGGCFFVLNFFWKPAAELLLPFVGNPMCACHKNAIELRCRGLAAGIEFITDIAPVIHAFKMNLFQHLF
jgi:hypothetical protein